MADMAPGSEGLCAAPVQKVIVRMVKLPRVIALATALFITALAAQVQTEVRFDAACKN